MHLRGHHANPRVAPVHPFSFGHLHVSRDARVRGPSCPPSNRPSPQEYNEYCLLKKDFQKLLPAASPLVFGVCGLLPVAGAGTPSPSPSPPPSVPLSRRRGMRPRRTYCLYWIEGIALLSLHVPRPSTGMHLLGFPGPPLLLPQVAPSARSGRVSSGRETSAPRRTISQSTPGGVFGAGGVSRGTRPFAHSVAGEGRAPAVAVQRQEGHCGPQAGVVRHLRRRPPPAGRSVPRSPPTPQPPLPPGVLMGGVAGESNPRFLLRFVFRVATPRVIRPRHRCQTPPPPHQTPAAPGTRSPQGPCCSTC